MAEDSKPHVLIVDDDEDIIILFDKHFERRRPNFTYYAVSKGQDAVDYVYRRGKFIDEEKYPICSLVLLDINIPGMNGFEVLEKIKENKLYRDFPLIATFTNSDFLQDRQKAMTLGAYRHIQKVANFFNLFPEIQEMLREAMDMNSFNSIARESKGYDAF